jgi:hypothetical protein
MPKPPKAKKTRRNQPVVFDETLIATLPLTPAPAAHQESTRSPRLTARQIHLGLGLIWILAAITGGIGIGRLILEARRPATVEAPVPVATAEVRIIPLTTTVITTSHQVTQPNLTVGSSSAVSQAQAGQPFAVMALASYQAATPDLQPGFLPAGLPQGNLGTTAVR